ncbi:MAG TPA: hypothetical protein VIL46_01245 [Gemmataceae bacterium]
MFIAHAPGDAALAAEIARAFLSNGLEAVTESALPPGRGAGDALWGALAESRALLVILSPSGPTTTMALVIGAALAWNKPILGVVPDPAAARVPPALTGVRLYPLGRIEDVIDEIKLAAGQLSDADRASLAEIYRGMGVSVDQLATDPAQLAELAKQFKAATGRTVPAERLLSELFRMRKQGKLAKSHPAGRSTHPSGTR